MITDMSLSTIRKTVQRYDAYFLHRYNVKNLSEDEAAEMVSKHVSLYSEARKAQLF